MASKKSEFPTRPHSLLALPLYRLDGLASRLSIVTATPQGTDSFLRTVCYLLQFFAGGWNSLSSSAQAQALAATVAAQAKLVLPPGDSLLVRAAPAAGFLTRTAPRAKALSSLISDFRAFARLWGLLGMYAWGKGLLVSPPKDNVLRACAWAQCAAYTAYQVLENRAYLAGKGVVPRAGGAKGIVSDWLWSTRCWLVAVAVEFVRLARTRSLRLRRLERGEITAAEEAAERRAWWREMVVNLTNAPLTVHWSVEGGTLSETAVGFLGALGGAIGLSERWKLAGAQVEAARLKAKAK